MTSPLFDWLMRDATRFDMFVTALAIISAFVAYWSI